MLFFNLFTKLYLLNFFPCTFSIQMAAIFPILDTYWCIATKWTRHMGFCITYTSLLMKTWRWDIYIILYIIFFIYFIEKYIEFFIFPWLFFHFHPNLNNIQISSLSTMVVMLVEMIGNFWFGIWFVCEDWFYLVCGTGFPFRFLLSFLSFWFSFFVNYSMRISFWSISLDLNWLHFSCHISSRWQMTTFFYIRTNF